MLSRRLGPLGAGLLATGCLWVNWGAGLICDPRYGTVRGAAALTAIPGTTIATWGWAWIVTGVLAAGGAFLPNRVTWIGLVPGTVMPCTWTLAYVVARLLDEFPQGFASGLTWLVSPVLLGLLAAVTRRWQEERQHRRRLQREVDELLAVEGGG
ncbi:hypothetical protein ACIQJX_34940 [Streptomyces griseoviridis]